ncbi:MAG: flagellar protein FlgN [Rhodospirillum sp.]|nr:flagellar protein FlgN [Rhodospirillum sp.]MCF8490661.1 flagellar protein FlgN [Rhodospirillum sp.]MCF8502968.1 flagellar protein FlgN [Rhodospirillum sp.]
MNTNDTGSRRASPFARGPVGPAPDATTPEAPAGKTTTPAPATSGGRSSPFASRSTAAAAATESPQVPFSKAPSSKAGSSKGEPATSPTSRVAGRMGARAETEPAAAVDLAKPPVEKASSARGSLRGGAKATVKAEAPPTKRRPTAIRRDRPKVPTPPMPKEIPGTVGPKITSLLFAMTELVLVLVEENDALDRHDTPHVRALMESKLLRTRYYQEQMLAVHANPRLLLDLDEEQREVMRAAAKILDTLARENGRKLKANIEATNRLMKAVVNAVRERELGRATTYSKGGAVEGDPTQAHRKAVTFNETL